MFRKILSSSVIISFLFTTLGPVPRANAGEIVMPLMPMPGHLVSLSKSYIPAHLRGIVIHPEDPFKFDFLVHRGNGHLDAGQKQQEYLKLVKYFLAALTVPDKDQWVNLSPYEKDRIIEKDLGLTVMGRDMLEQDYLLKQITSSLMYPESGLGKEFWNKVYDQAYKQYGTTNIPANTFNKVWIVPDEAVVYEHGNTAFIVKSHLKVMLEEDYLSLRKHLPSNFYANTNKTHSIASKIIRLIILPALEQEVNEGKNFATLRQIFNSMLLATWYKKALKESILTKIYADKDKVQGVGYASQTRNVESIYREYLAAYKKGVYNYIKEDEDKYSGQTIPRKYFSGGEENLWAKKAMFVPTDRAGMNKALAAAGDKIDMAVVTLDQAQVTLGLGTTQEQLTKIVKDWRTAFSAIYGWTPYPFVLASSLDSAQITRARVLVAILSLLQLTSCAVRQTGAPVFLTFADGQTITIFDTLSIHTPKGDKQAYLAGIETVDYGDGRGIQYLLRLDRTTINELVVKRGIPGLFSERGSAQKPFLDQIPLIVSPEKSLAEQGLRDRGPLTSGNALDYLIKEYPSQWAAVQAWRAGLPTLPSPTAPSSLIAKAPPETPAPTTSSLPTTGPNQQVSLLMRRNIIDQASLANPGGIDFNPANFAMLIKREGKGFYLSPAFKGNLSKLIATISGFSPRIVEIKPLSVIMEKNLP